MLLQPDAKLALMPDSTKTGAKDGAMHVDLTDASYSAVPWLRRDIAAYEEAGQPITNWITRPLTRDKRSFQEMVLSSSVIAERRRLHWKAAGSDDGQTVHGSRRGSMQHDAYVLGKTLEEIAESAQIRTPAIVRRYLDIRTGIFEFWIQWPSHTQGVSGLVRDPVCNTLISLCAAIA